MRVTTLAAATIRVSKLIKNVGAVAAGFVIWFITSLVVVLISTFIWEHSPDRYASIALNCWIGTTLGLILAGAAKERISPQMPDRTLIIILGVLILLWVAGGLISGVDVDFKLVGLAAHALAIGIAGWRTHAGTW